VNFVTEPSAPEARAIKAFSSFVTCRLNEAQDIPRFLIFNVIFNAAALPGFSIFAHK